MSEKSMFEFTILWIKALAYLIPTLIIIFQNIGLVKI